MVQCHPRNIFNIELFPNYGISIYMYVCVFIFLQALEEEMSAHYSQFDTVVTNGLQVDKERVDRLWIDLKHQVAVKKMFVIAGLELQQVCVSVCVCVCMYVCMCVCVYESVSVFGSVYLRHCVCLSLCISVCVWVCACIHAHMQV